jgi:hypothetical protein
MLKARCPSYQICQQPAIKQYGYVHKTRAGTHRHGKCSVIFPGLCDGECACVRSFAIVSRHRGSNPPATREITAILKYQLLKARERQRQSELGLPTGTLPRHTVCHSERAASNVAQRKCECSVQHTWSLAPRSLLTGRCFGQVPRKRLMRATS